MTIEIDFLMKKPFVNFLYSLLEKTAKNYYGESLNSEVPYTPYI